MLLKGKKACFLGDSITEGYGTSDISKRYADVFKEISGVKDIFVDGISGTRIARQQNINPDLIIWDTNEFTKRADMLPDDADIVVVFGGTNDYGHGDAPFGENTDETEDTFCGALNVLFKKLIRKYPSSTIVFMTPLHRTDEQTRNKSNSLILKDYVDKIKELASYYSVPVLDMFAQSGMQPCIDEQREVYFMDGVHPNDAGSRRIAEKLLGFLTAM
ncbi:MAG: SGNH/GDSL hydrolase family protein [Clostridia bacterium]|nr:SGNH/GDSL hydrolase family protein [Clostridia bacterium]